MVAAAQHYHRSEDSSRSGEARRIVGHIGQASDVSGRANGTMELERLKVYFRQQRDV
jgi:hypothetical protein